MKQKLQQIALSLDKGKGLEPPEPDDDNEEEDDDDGDITDFLNDDSDDEEDIYDAYDMYDLQHDDTNNSEGTASKEQENVQSDMTETLAPARAHTRPKDADQLYVSDDGPISFT